MNTEVEFDEKGLVAKVAHAALDVLRRTGAYAVERTSRERGEVAARRRAAQLHNDCPMIAAKLPRSCSKLPHR